MVGIGPLPPQILHLGSGFPASEGENGGVLFRFDTYTYPAMEMEPEEKYRKYVIGFLY